MDRLIDQADTENLVPEGEVFSRNRGLLTFGQVRSGVGRVLLNLALLYQDERGRDRFEKKWPAFFVSDRAHPRIFRREANGDLSYRTESLVPSKPHHRLPVLLLLGNPASHSVLSGMCFAFEGAHREHRFWVALRKTGLLEFRSDASLTHLTWDRRNRVRKRELFDLEYDSPFCIGIGVYFSMPSAASSSPWAGVAGLRKLFGRKALSAIAEEERRRIERTTRGFMVDGGGVIAFQRDAYEGVRACDAPPYSLDAARKGELRGVCRHDSRIRLFGAPPTRLIPSRRVQGLLAQFRTSLLSHSAQPGT